MNVKFLKRFRDYNNGDTVIHIPKMIVDVMELKHRDLLDIDYADGIITITRHKEDKKK